MNMNRQVKASSAFKVLNVSYPKATPRRINGAPVWVWKLRNIARWQFVKGLLARYVGLPLAHALGLMVAIVEMRAVVRLPGQEPVDLGVVGRRVITTAWVNNLTDQLQGSGTAIANFKYHDAGTGTTSPVAGDTTMETAWGGSRATGSQAEGASANIYKTVGQIVFDNTYAITEWGVFSASTSGILMDRDTFAALNMVDGASITMSVEATFPAGS